MKEKIFSDLRMAMKEYDDEKVRNLILESINQNIDPIATLNILTESIAEIGDSFGKGELWLPDLMLASKTMKCGLEPLEVEIKKRGLKKYSIGKVVIGTVYGDLHSIGKGMVSTLLSANGFEVIDLGINVDSVKFIDAIKIYSPDILAMSSLLTTTSAEMSRVINSLIEAGIRNQIKIIVGGGPITAEFARSIGADGYEPTAPLAVQLAKNLLKNK